MLFHAWIAGKIDSPLKPEPIYADIQQLNTWAQKGDLPLIKLSFATLASVLDRYQLLPVGAAIGYNCGPKIIAREKRKTYGTIAIPGEDTTAHLLFNRLGLRAEHKHFCRFDEIYSLLHEKKVDSGLIIHESRFTFQDEGFVELADLGELWGGMIPLGALAVKRDFKHIPELISTLKASLSYAKAHPKAAQNYILEKAQESDPDVVYNHIQTYVNDETMHISKDGMEAIRRLIGDLS